MSTKPYGGGGGGGGKRPPPNDFFSKYKQSTYKPLKKRKTIKEEEDEAKEITKTMKSVYGYKNSKPANPRSAAYKLWYHLHKDTLVPEDVLELMCQQLYPEFKRPAYKAHK